MILRAAALSLAALALSACATVPAGQHAAALPDAAPFDAQADASADLAAALAAAELTDRKVLAVFGANWCHDSRALAGWLESPRFQALTESAYKIVYIESGVPQTGKGRNLDLAAQYGVSDIKGTPTMLALGADGTLLNTPEDARSWRNAASRSEGEIEAWLTRWTGTSA